MCLGLEAKANRVYETFSRNTDSEDLSIFWKQMAEEEHEHVAYWQDVLDMVRANPLDDFVDQPEAMRDDLRRVTETMDAILRGDGGRDGVQAMFLTAYRMEFAMLHPAFGILFRLIPCTPEKCPERGYAAHLKMFTAGLKKYGRPTPEMELIGDLIQRLWHENRELASQAEQIRKLRKLLPICASCKKIRDDRGYWQEVEVYFRDHADLEFTHGFCADCIAKLYPQAAPKPKVDKAAGKR